MTSVLVSGRRACTTVLSASLVLILSAPSWATDLFVAPNGSPQNDGAIDRPLDLATALSTESPAQPGDTIWLRGGVYFGPFTSHLVARSDATITVRQYPGEHATLDGNGSPLDVLTVHGAWTVFWGFEIRSTDPVRTTFQTGPWPTNMNRGGAVSARGEHLKFINLVVHDLLSGISVWTESVDTEVYGSILSYNGWQGGDRSHGHAIYTQNVTGRRLLRDNILFNQFSHGIHAFGSDAANVDYITLEGNVAFNNGFIGTTGEGRDILLGGARVALNPVMRENYTYGTSTSNLGFAGGCSDGEVFDNYFMGRDPLTLVNCAPEMTGNRFYSTSAPFGSLPAVYPDNTYYLQRPLTSFVTVRPNLYEPGRRGHVIVYNWAHDSAVQVDLSPLGLVAGDEYEIRDAQDFYGSPVLTGVFGGQPIWLPMVGLTLSPPVGNVPRTPAHTSPEFGVFVVLRTSGGTVIDPPEKVATPVIAPAGGHYDSPQLVTITTTTPGAEIRYTLNGTKPTRASTLFSAPFSVAVDRVVRARAFAPDMLDSHEVVTSFTITDHPPAVQVVSPSHGAQVSGAVMLAAQTLDDHGVAAIAFHANGVPIAESTASPFQVAWDSRFVGNGHYDVTAIARDTAGQTVTSAAIAIQVANPPVAPRPDAARLLMEAESGAITSPMAISNSSTASAGQFLGNTTSNQGSVSLSFVAPAAGDYFVWLRMMSFGPDSLRISVDGGPELFYTVPSSKWLFDWQWVRMTGAPGTAGAYQPVGFTLASGPHTIRLRTVQSINRLDAIFVTDDAATTPLSAPPVGVVAPPAVVPPGGTFAEPVSVSLATTTPGAQVRFTTDGSAPSAASPLYAAPFLVATTGTVRARAFASGMIDSTEAAAAFVIGSVPSAAAPTIHPPGGTFAVAQTVSLSTATAGAQIRYTTDGSAPTSAASLYTGPFVLSSTTLLRARTFASGLGDSAETSALFTVTTGSPGGAFKVWLEAEAGVLQPPMAVAPSSEASGGQYLGNTTSNAGSTVVTFSAPTAGLHHLWLRQMSYSPDSLHVSMDGGPEQLFSAPEAQWFFGWQWFRTPLTFELGPGSHHLRLRTGQAITRLDAVFVTTDPNATPVPTAPPPPPPPPGQAMKIMPLGDSITYGIGLPDYGGYRINLYEFLTDAGLAFDFVGMLSSGPNGLPDKEHDGHNGWTLAEIHASVHDWLTALQPRVILLMAGTNDILQSLPDRSASLGALIDKILVHAPTATIVVGTIAPLSDPALNPQVAEFNASIPGIVAARAAAGRQVFFADIGGRLGPAHLTGDGVHPNAAGYDLMADAWFERLIDLLDLEYAAATPVIDPAGGTFTGDVTVAITTTTAGADIRYTLDGTAPTTASPLYTGAFPITTSASVRAVAVVAGRPDSAAAAATFTIVPRQVATPVVSPAGGTFTAPVVVTLATATAGAEVHYTLDGTAPTAASPVYTTPLIVTASGTTVRARASAALMTDSSEATATFVIQLPSVQPVSIEPPGGSFTGEVAVTLASSTTGAAIHYTTDGSPPTSGSPRYTGPLTITTAVTVRARAFAEGMQPSADASAVFVPVDANAPVARIWLEAELGALTAPMSVAISGTASGGRYLGNTTSNQGSVALSMSTSSAGVYHVWIRTMSYSPDSLYVSVDGGPERLYAVPSSKWVFAWQWIKLTTSIDGAMGEPFAYPLPAGTHTLRFRTGQTITRLDAVFVTNDPATTPTATAPAARAASPTIAPPGGTFTAPVSVTLTTATSGAQIRYTTNGAEPTSASALYAGPFLVGSTSTIRARAFAAGLLESIESSAAFVLAVPAPPVATPTFSPPGGTFSGAVPVTIASTTGGATIRYTLNGSEPSAGSPVYGGPVTVGSTSMIRARAFMTGMADSAIAEATYTIAPATGRTEIRLEAEAGQIAPPMTIANSGDASGGRFLGNTATNQGSVTLSFATQAGDVFYVWLRTMSPSDDSLYVSIDGGAEVLHTVPVDRRAFAWRWIRLTPVSGPAPSYPLGPGPHTMRLRTGKGTTRLDVVLLTNDASWSLP